MITDQAAERFAAASAADSTAYTTSQITLEEWKARVAVRDARWKVLSPAERTKVMEAARGTNPR